MKLPHFSLKRVAKRRPSRRECVWFTVGALVVVGVFGILHLLHTQEVPLRPESSTITAPWISPTVKRWSSTIDEMAQKYNIDPNLLAIIMTLESGGYSKANSGQAEGLMQITPLTATDIASKYLKKPVKTYDLYNPKTSIEFGAAYLAHLRKIFGDVSQGPSWDSTVELVAAGYNGGPGAAGHLYRGEGLTDTQTVVYSRDAFNMWRERQAKVSPTYNRWLERGGSTLVDDAKAEKI